MTYDMQVRKEDEMAQIFYTLSIFLILLGFQAIYRRAPKSFFAIMTVFSAIIAPFWLEYAGLSSFAWIKYYSVLVGIGWITLFKVYDFKNTAAKVVIHAILSLNIVEAIGWGVSKGGLDNILIAISGALLLVTLGGVQSIGVDRQSRFKDFCWGTMSMPWIIGYTIWNWMFAYINFNYLAIDHLAVLAAALVGSWNNPKRWLEARAVTLGVYLGLINSTYMLTELSQLFKGEWYHQTFSMVASSIVVGYLLIYTSYLYFGGKKAEADHEKSLSDREAA